MKKVLVIIIALFFYWISYQVRLGFLVTGDFNEPSDAKEYRLAAVAVKNLWNIFTGTLKLENAEARIAAVKHNFSGANTHGAPLYNAYVAILEYKKLTPGRVAPVLHAGFVVLLFWTALWLFPLPVALAVGIISVFYTPLFAFVYSWMPEQVTAVVIPTLALAASYLVLRKCRLFWYGVAGFILFLMGLMRHVFSYYGLIFIALWMLTEKKGRRKETVVLVAAYAIPLIAWGVLVKLAGVSIYGAGGIESTFMNAHTLATDGWWMDGVRVSGWADIFSRLVLHQNIISLSVLELERINRLWRHAANSYGTSFPFFEQSSLQLVHIFILFFAAWGMRAALRNRFLLLISSLVFWNTVFVSLFYVEEIRYQIPVLGIVLLLAGAGLGELRRLWDDRRGKYAVLSLCGLFISWFFLRSHILGVEFQIVPFISDSRVWRGIHFFVAGVVVLVAIRILWRIDQKAKLVIRYRWANALLTGIVLMFLSIIMAPVIRSKTWHEWRKPLYSGEEIHQEITLGKNAVAKLRDLNGYLIIDQQDSNAAQFLQVTLNGQELRDRVPMKKRMSPVDLRAVRQWQRTLPRLGGYTGVEDILAEAAAWPNFHEWLAIPIQGSLLEKINNIVIKNNSIFGGNPPYFFGDYPPYGTGRLYEGPTGRLFQGPRTHNKYQVEGDMRLPELRQLQSVSNKSTLRIGRFRIFFLFPLLGGDPEDLL